MMPTIVEEEPSSSGEEVVVGETVSTAGTSEDILHEKKEMTFRKGKEGTKTTLT